MVSRVTDMPLNLTPQEVADRLRMSVGHLANLRCSGDGPPFFKRKRHILYPLKALEAWEKAQMHRSTHVKA